MTALNLRVYPHLALLPSRRPGFRTTARESVGRSRPPRTRRPPKSVGRSRTLRTHGTCSQICSQELHSTRPAVRTSPMPTPRMHAADRPALLPPAAGADSQPGGRAGGGGGSYTPSSERRAPRIHVYIRVTRRPDPPLPPGGVGRSVPHSAHSGPGEVGRSVGSSAHSAEPGSATR